MNDPALQPDVQAALAHHQAGRLDQAEALYRQVLTARPNDISALHLCGKLALARGRPADAVGLLGQAAHLLPSFAPVHLELATALHAAGRMAAAAERYRRTLAIDASLADAWHGLGITLAKLGHTVEAIEALRRTVALQPDRAAAHWDLAVAGHGESVQPLAAMLRRPDLPPKDRITAGFALAALLDQAGQYDEAFQRLREANNLLQARLEAAGETFNAAELRAYVAERIAAWRPASFAAHRDHANPSDLPVFVVGMPRSGTTLTEQILASHPQVHGIGEGHYLASAIAAADQAAWALAACRHAADAHIARLHVMGGSASRVVDKTPDNLFHLGPIAALFSGARVIVCRRDPRDIALSCYFQSFAEPMPYANDLAACAARIQEVDRMLAHWQSVLPLRMLEVRYESLVADLEGESRRLIGFLGLEWDPRCLDFHRTQRVVQSASLWQVRQPIYERSVGRWRHYARHLGPLLEVFGRD